MVQSAHFVPENSFKTAAIRDSLGMQNDSRVSRWLELRTHKSLLSRSA